MHHILSVKTTVDSILIVKCMKRWEDLVFCLITKKLWKPYNAKRTEVLLLQSLVVGVLTRHCLMGAHFTKIRLVASEFCRNCKRPDESETVEYLLRHYPVPAKKASQIFCNIHL